MSAHRDAGLRRIRVGQRYREAAAPSVVWEVVGVMTGPRVVPHAYISQGPGGRPGTVQLVSWEALGDRHVFERAETGGEGRIRH